jgi:hypothetical protein
MNAKERNPVHRKAEEIRGKCGRTLLSEEELLVLMADILVRTTTFEELRFLQPDDDHA